MKTKDRILNGSLALFNEKGAIDSSLRQIAAYLGMSDGNLRYHYKTKEAIVIDLYTQLGKAYTEIISEEINNPNPTLESLKDLLRKTYAVNYQFRFIYLESSFLLKKYPAFREYRSQRFSLRVSNMLDILRGLEKNSDDIHFPDGHHIILYEQVFIIADSWLKYCLADIKSKSDLEKYIEHYVQLTASLFLPYTNNTIEAKG